MHPLNPRLHECLSGDCNALSLNYRRIRKNGKKELSAVSQRESQKVKPPKPRGNTVKRQKLFAPDEPRKGAEIPDSAAGIGMRTTSVHVDSNVDCKQVALDVNVGAEGVKNPMRKLLVDTQLLEAKTMLLLGQKEQKMFK